MSQETLTDPQDVRELLEQVRRNAVQLVAEVGRTPRNLRVRAGDIAVEIEWDESEHVPAPAVTAAPPDTAVHLTAPAVGVFYRAPKPGADPFVRAGDVVRVGQQVGIVEAMKLMIPVEADQAGRITEILKQDGEPVEYGENLFAIEDE